MIKTGNYKSFNNKYVKTISISGDRGKEEGYTGECYPKLAPKLDFWKTYHDNIGVVTEEQNIRFYIEEYYKQVLSMLNPQKVYTDLDHSILLCYEDNSEFCHRHIVAAWLELFLNVEVAEAKLEGYRLVDISRPDYVKPILEEIIRKNRNMRGFTSLHALYLFESAELLEEKANQWEEETGKSCDSYRQLACYLRCEADEAEAEYRIKKNKKDSKR